MKKEKGFTLIEMLGVIIIISILLVILVPIVVRQLKTSKDSIYDSLINRILSSSVDWASENTSFLPNEGESINITLGTLQSGGYISTDLKNPKTNLLFPADMIIKIKYIKSNQKNKKLSYGKYDGNYSFQVDINSGTEIDNIKDSYTVIQLNETSANVDKIVYKDLSDNDISLKEYNVQIVNNNINVPSIDTSKLGIYYVYYSNNSGKDSFVRVFNVADTELPQIIFKENDAISVNISEFDLYSNVSCEDNSGTCNLTITEGEQELYDALANKTTGNYVITYKATDGFGNMVTKKRVIEITE